jgi:hypothetical protein
MATTYEIIQGLHQAAANAYDGSQYERYALDGEPRKIGLRREQGDPIIDSRVMDGFKIKILGNMLYVHYQTDVLMENFVAPKFTNEVESIMADIESFLKKEYKAITKSAISFKKEGDLMINIEPVSRKRNTVLACQKYVIEALKDVVPVGERSEDLTRDVTKKFLAMGRQDAKKSSNDTRKAEPKSKK